MATSDASLALAAMNARSSRCGGYIESLHVAVADMNDDRMLVVDVDGVVECIMDGGSAKVFGSAGRPNNRCPQLPSLTPQSPDASLSPKPRPWIESRLYVGRHLASLTRVLTGAPQKLEQLRIEADQATARAEEAEAKVKVLEQEHLSKEQEITSLSHKLTVLETENEKIEGQLVTAKQGRLDGESSSKDVENLQRKIQLLEDELDQAEKNLKETVEKCVP